MTAPAPPASRPSCRPACGFVFGYVFLRSQKEDGWHVYKPDPAKVQEANETGRATVEECVYQYPACFAAPDGCDCPAGEAGRDCKHSRLAALLASLFPKTQKCVVLSHADAAGYADTGQEHFVLYLDPGGYQVLDWARRKPQKSGGEYEVAQ